MADRNTGIGSEQIRDDSLLPRDLSITGDEPTDNRSLVYDSGTNKFKWTYELQATTLSHPDGGANNIVAQYLDVQSYLTVGVLQFESDGFPRMNMTTDVEDTDYLSLTGWTGNYLKFSLFDYIEFDDPVQINEEIYFDSEYDNGNSGASTTIDWTSANKQKLTLTDNATINFSNPSGPCNIILKLVQDATGSRDPIWSVPSGQTLKWAGGTEPTWSTGAGEIDIVTFYYDGTDYYGAANLNFS